MKNSQKFETQETFVDKYMKQIEYAKFLLKEYEAIPTGVFGCIIIRKEIENAEKALKENNVVDMVKCYASMQGLE